MPILGVLSNAEKMKEAESSDPLKREYLVRVELLETVPENDAVKEIGFLGNQNTVCQPLSQLATHR